MITHRGFQFSILLLYTLLGEPAAAQEESKTSSAVLDTARIEELTGIKGKFDATEDVFKVSVPRDDPTVTVAGVPMVTPMGLTSWAAFKHAGDGVMVMGDIVLQEDQIDPVMSAALDNGIQVTALHNHFLWDTPRVMFMHIGGQGDPEKLATGVGKIFTRLKETSGGKDNKPRSSFDAGKTSLDPNPIESIIGTPAEKAGTVYKVTLGRSTRMAGHEVGKAMGVNTWAVFAGSNQKAIVEGDFAMLESELQDVLKALRGAGISITTIHNHMVGESPKIMFLHYWGAGSVRDLAKAIRVALDTQAKSRS